MNNSKDLVSVIIRTLNEERYLDELLTSIRSQISKHYSVEIVIVDSGSNDDTINIANKHNCRITYIDKSEFTFGRSLNIGCDFANGKYLIFVSGHCIPRDCNWLDRLVRPLEKSCAYTYGRQIGRDTTKFSEEQIFAKYFPRENSIPQIGFFCNNANAAIRKDEWETHRFDEELTGCEDMFLAKKLVMAGKKIGYVADAVVYHIHDESWSQVKRRYEREALALQSIMPEVHISATNFVTYTVVGIIKDLKASIKRKKFFREVKNIIFFRTMQYYGTYKGNHLHRKISQAMKIKYFYPRVSEMSVTNNYSKDDKE